MEDKNYRNEFELFLKENADEFRMIPSRKVWYSIYNNVHPAKKWPSMAVCLLILTAVLYMGIENNNSLSNAARKNASSSFDIGLNEKKINTKNIFISSIADNSSNPQQNVVLPYASPTSIGATKTLSTVSQNNLPEIFISGKNDILTDITETPKKVLVVSDINKSSFSFNNKLKLANSNNLLEENEAIKVETTSTLQKETTVVMQKDDDTSMAIAIPVSENNNDKFLKNLLLNTEKSWMEDYAFRNKPAINKMKDNGSISYYITPSIGYRSFSKRGLTKAAPNTASNFSAQNFLRGNVLLDDNAEFNFELGVSYQFKISKNIRIKTGLQANYTNYTSNVTSLGHPSEITLAVSNYHTVYSASNYSSSPGSAKLNKTTIQLSIPVGADVKVAGTGKVQLFVGATLQPTYLLKGSAYVLSSDAEYYGKEPGLLRKINLNSAIETFVSFKSSRGVTMSVGPQFRYQLLSTYKEEYNYSEKLYNIGLKLGISTSF